MTNPLKQRKKPTNKSIRQSIRQAVRQSVIINLANPPKRRKRRPPLSNSNKPLNKPLNMPLEVRHVHLYNTPTQNPMSIDNAAKELKKVQLEMKLLKEERQAINNDLFIDRIKASTFTENNPLSKPIPIQSKEELIQEDGLEEDADYGETEPPPAKIAYSQKAGITKEQKDELRAYGLRRLPKTYDGAEKSLQRHRSAVAKPQNPKSKNKK